MTAFANHFGKQTVYKYSVTGGQIVGEGSQVTWDLGGASPGFYTATVEVRDKQHHAISAKNVTVATCSDCVFEDFPCPVFFITCYDKVKAGTPITCKVVLYRGTYSNPTAYQWSARDSSDEDLSEKIKRSGEYISIPTDGLAGRTVYVRLDLKGLDSSCNTAASSSTKVQP